MKRVRIAVFVLLGLSVILLCITSGLRFINEDNTLPVISCTQAELSISVKDGSDALLQGVTAKDAKDGDISDSIVVEKIISNGTPGKVNVTYAVADSDDHIASCTRVVTYSDYFPPRFALSAPLTYNVGETLKVRDRLTATDMVDGSLTDRIKISADHVSTSSAGTFPITMEVTNSLGDTSSLTLNITVREAERDIPEIRLTQYLLYLDDPNAEFDPAKYISSVVNGEKGNVKAAVYGKFKQGVNRVTYSCTNSSGLTGTTTLYIIVE